jgi:hypothetical protein
MLQVPLFPANVSLPGSLQNIQDWLTMVNLRTFTSLTYLSQVVFLGGNAQTNSSQLGDIVPKREVFYAGGKYANITASADIPYLPSNDPNTKT